MTSRNGRFLKGGFSGLMIAAAIFCGASAAQADYSDENIATTDDSVRRLEVGGGGWTGANQFGGKGGSGTVILVFRQTDLGGWRLRG